MKAMERMIALLFAVACLLTAAPAFAVDLTATIKGDIVDPDGLPVPNAGITLSSPDLIGGAQTSVSDDAGRFRFVALPPGAYDLMIEHPSFAVWRSEGLQVTGGSSVQLTVTLKLKGVMNEITVYDDRPAVNTEAVQQGVVIDSRFMKHIPSNRDYQSALQLAPGVIGGGNPNVRGGFDSSNQYYINGVNTTDPVTNTFSMNMNWDAIESIEVITGGMDAEYGRSLGGAMNIITKSGGNEFEGNATLVYSDNRMVIAPSLPGDSNDASSSQELTMNLGGPIVKDRVWFYASAQGNRQLSTFSFDPEEIPRDLEQYPVAPRNWRSLYLFGKVTAQLTPAHRVWVHAQTDPTWIDNVEQNPYTLPTAETVQNQGGWLGSFGHVFTPSKTVLMENQAYFQKSYIDFYPILWKDCQSRDAYGACQDDFGDSWYAYDPDGFNVGEHAYSVFEDRYRASANNATTIFFDALGEHRVKAGVQAELLWSKQVYPGIEEGLVYYAHDGDPTHLEGYSPALKYQYDNNYEANYAGTMISWYLQDVWKPFPRLTVRPGVRFDAPGLRDDLGQPVLTNLTVAPRLGVAYDLTGDGKTRVHAFYGRFYDSGFLAISDLLRKRSSGYKAYSWDEETGDWGTEPTFAAAGAPLQHEDFKNPWSDEIDVGLSREVGHGFGVDVNFTFEEARGFWEDDEVNLIWNADGTDVIGYRNGVNEAQYRMRTPDDLFTRYTSLEIVGRQMVAENWSFLGSYTWSRAIGTNSADQATSGWDVPEQRQYETGLLDYDRTHVLKLTGAFWKPDVYTLGKLRGGYSLGFDGVFSTGTPYRPVVWNDYYEDYTNLVSPADGRYRLPMIAETNARAALTWETDGAAWSLGADVFNLFNDRTITAVNTAFDPDAVGDEQTFGEVLDRQSPRSMQVVLRGEF